MERDQNNKNNEAVADQGNEQNKSITVPGIALPKGGGAIRGIGEKFAANPVTGTGSMTIPIATSPGRSGFGPQLSLAYDSGAGNGPFGLGWNLSLPSITRKTDKGLPKYRSIDEPDVFILSGAEDLVPTLVQNQTGDWIAETVPPRTIQVEGIDRSYAIQRYRPRIEGLFARIESWSNQADPADTFWRSISKDNISTWYGKQADSRIVDPADPTRIFSWLICESYDDKGNVIRYEYKPEDSDGINLFQANEHNRSSNSRATQRYLKRIQYGNVSPYFPNSDTTLPTDWMFETVFDYGEHSTEAPTPSDNGIWPARKDPFSHYRAGFEVRTYRLCQRVLMFHHFEDEPEVGLNCLTRSTDFNYHHQQSPADPRNPVHSVINSVSQCAYQKKANQRYSKKTLPPVEFTYSPVIWGDKIETVASGSTENLPTGVDGSQYQWLDLDGEGLSGVLSEQGGAWHYKHNESPVTREVNDNQARYRARLGATIVVATMPAGGLRGASSRQFLNLAGNGKIDLAELSPPLAGFYERTDPAGEIAPQSWHRFRPFQSLPNINWNDPNLKFIDLNGDGHADILISENEVFTWYPSLAEQGFDQSRRVHIPTDEELGPRIIFADPAQTMFQADLSGDGLTDIVRIRNGDVCYWPNLGYGRFGAKVSMDNAPHFDHPDQFDPSRLRLTDIDGTGTIDIIYLGRNNPQFWFNQSGNGWSDAHTLEGFPAVDNVATVAVVDLLGNGTACLVWSSPLPGEAHAPMRYIELMAAGKPHLLNHTKNNLGAETHIQYTPSTYFYLKDKQAGKPWITKLPFPVHVVEKVTVTDQWNKTTFSSTYSYHHGYFDGKEREFRGFGRVEQIDSESFGEFSQGNSASPFITDDHTLYQPPIKTVTWYHTGVMIDREKILSQFKHEYFPQSLVGDNPAVVDVLGGFKEADLPEPDIKALNLNAEETREALRACKGTVLRQEVYELDVDALSQGKHQPIKLFSTAYHNCYIQSLQPRNTNPHAVFLVTESEAVSYQYELELLTETLTPAPRISHSFNLNIDEYGNVLQAVAVVYPRRGEHQDDTLEPQALQLIRDVQQEIHIAYSENHFTNDIDEADLYRLRVPCEALSYELTGITPSDDYFTLKELRRLKLNESLQDTGIAVAPLDYHQHANPAARQKHIVEHSKILYFDDRNPGTPAFLKAPMPFNQQGNLGLPYETYSLALSDDLLSAVLTDKFTPAIQAELNDATKSGYIKGDKIGGAPDQYWVRSGIAGFAADAAEHFFLPERYTDAFEQVTRLEFDARDLFIASSSDPVGNRVAVTEFDYRVLAPREIKDINDNLNEATFDTLGLPTAVVVKGKGDQADNLTAFTDDLLNPALDRRIDFFTQTYSEAEARELLGNASARHIYDFGELQANDGTITYGHRPAAAAAILRERHVAEPLLSAEGAELPSPLQVAFEYSDGGGNVLVTKAQAEPENSVANPAAPLRWIANGKTILNNKGKPVKQYEPYFSELETAPGVFEPDHRFAEPKQIGVTPLMYYDAAGQLIRTESPDGSVSRVEYSPWHVTSYDANDTVLEPDNRWFAEHSAAASPAKQRAAAMAAQHANTPAQVFLDSLGREVISIEHNKIKDDAGTFQDEKYLTFSKLDAEGKPLWIRDARRNLVMQYIFPPKANNASDDTIPANSVPCYDIAGNLLFQHSMDGGDRWMINDATGQPFVAWDENENEAGDFEERLYHTVYDNLRRPGEQHFQIINEPAQSPPKIIERFVYGEDEVNAKSLNLRGQLIRHYDSSGLLSATSFDFKGNLLAAKRELITFSTESITDWIDINAVALDEPYTQTTQYDALNRMTSQHNWHIEARPPAIYTPQYNQRGLLLSEALQVKDETTKAIVNIEYDAKGQRTRIQYGNGTSTRYFYDEKSFRLLQLRTTKTSPGELLPTPPANLSDGNALQNLYYSYDPIGNITEIRDDAYEPVFFNNQQVEPRSRYTYDALYRLIEAEGREHINAKPPTGGKLPETVKQEFAITDQTLRNYTQTYIYDSVGNIEKMMHVANDGAWTRDYEYETDNNRLKKTQQGTNTVDYNYDTHGSMLNLNSVADEYRLHWDSNDMIHHINLGGGGDAFYDYGSDKERSRKRIIKNDGNIIEERLYRGGMERYRRWVNGNLKEEIETYHLFDGEQRVLIVENVLETDNQNLDEGVLFRYQYGNHLGSVGLELDAVGKVISYEEYHPYGTTAFSARNGDIKAAKKRYRYTGMERDEESGLSYHSARYYLPWLGRWGSVDPAGVDGGLDLYGYGGGNPITYIDTTGLGPDKPKTFFDWVRRNKQIKIMVEALRGSTIVISSPNEPHKPPTIPKPAGHSNVDNGKYKTPEPTNEKAERARQKKTSISGGSGGSGGGNKPSKITPGATYKNSKEVGELLSRDIKDANKLKWKKFTEAFENHKKSQKALKAGVKGVSGAVKIAKIVAVMPDPTDVIFMGLSHINSLVEAKEAMKSRKFKGGFQAGLAASLIGFERYDVRNKLSRGTHNRGYAQIFLGANNGEINNSYNEGLLSGYLYARSLTSEMRGELLEYAFNVLADNGVRLTQNLSSYIDALETGNALNSFVTKVFDDAAKEAAAEQREKARVFMMTR